jgi:hypothetical protein
MIYIFSNIYHLCILLVFVSNYTTMHCVEHIKPGRSFIAAPSMADLSRGEPASTGKFRGRCLAHDSDK